MLQLLLFAGARRSAQPSPAPSAIPGSNPGAATQPGIAPAVEKEEEPKKNEPVDKVPIHDLADHWADLVGKGKKKGGTNQPKAKAKGKAKAKATTAKAKGKAKAKAAKATNVANTAARKRPAAHVSAAGNGLLRYPGVPTKINKPVHIDGWKIYTSLKSCAWRVYEDGNKIDKKFHWGGDGSLGPTAWKSLCDYITEGSK